MLRGRVPSAQGFLSSNQNDAGLIEFKGVDGGAARRTESKRVRTFPAKVNAPRIRSGIEQAGLFSRGGINRRLLCTLAQRARDTGEGKISGSRFSASIDRSDVINVKTGPLADLGETAIFAAVSRPLDHVSPQWGRNKHCLRRRAFLYVRPAIEATKESRPVRQDPQLHAVRPWSTRVHHPACRAGFGAFDAPLLAGESASNHLASQLKRELVVPYTVPSPAPSLHDSIAGVQAEFVQPFSPT